MRKGIDSARGHGHPVGAVSRHKVDPFLRVIAVFKLLKALLFVAAGVGLLHFFNRDMESSLEHLLDDWHIDPDDPKHDYIRELIVRIGNLTDTHLKLVALSLASFVYAALFAVEGTGLFLGKKWAEWMVVIITSTLLPVELYEIAHHVTALKIVVTAINVLIIVYLVILIRHNGRDRDKKAG